MSSQTAYWKTTALLEHSPLKTMLDFVRRWAKARGNHVFHLGGGIGSAEDSLLHFKSGFSERRQMFHSWRVVLDEARYAALRGASQAGPATDFFPAYRRLESD